MDGWVLDAGRNGGGVTLASKPRARRGRGRRGTGRRWSELGEASEVTQDREDKGSNRPKGYVGSNRPPTLLGPQVSGSEGAIYLVVKNALG
jgi:hypothetical protein